MYLFPCLTSARLLVLFKPIAKVTGTDWARAGVVAAMGAAPVVGFTTVHDLHFYPWKRHTG